MLASASPWRARLARAGALIRTALEALYYEGPISLARQQWLWLRKRWYYAMIQPRWRPGAAEAVAARASQAMPSAPTPPCLAPNYTAHQSSPGVLRVLFIASVEHPLSKRYRVDNIQTRLRLRGVITHTIYDIDVAWRMAYALRFDVIVLQRLAATPELRHLAALAQERGIAVIFDADDDVFEPALIPRIAALRAAPAAKVEEHHRYVAGCREMLLLCDGFIGSTEFLAERVRALGVRSFVVGNGVNARQVRLADQALVRPGRGERANGLVRIGYQPGTRTHAQDFACAIPTLLRLMHERPEVVLVVQGPLQISPELSAFGQRIERRHYVSWPRLVAATAALDIAIAPLEPDNPINEAKSALKYFEPALVAVPVIASPTAEMRRAIEHGITGMLAANDDEWYAALRALAGDPARRATMGAAARADVLTHATPWPQSAATLAVFHAIAGRADD